jgi:hypothetical protein
MLKIIIELYPKGSEKGKKTLSEIFIANTGVKEEEETVYKYSGWFKKDKFPYEEESNNFIDFGGKALHNRKENVYSLLIKIFKQLTKK